MATMQKQKPAAKQAQAAADTPGQILKSEYMAQFGMSVADLAADLDIEPKTLRAVIANKRPIDNDLARKLCATFGNGPQFWQRLSRDYVAAERRRNARFAAEMPATLQSQCQTVDCIVQDMSRSGARLLVKEAETLADTLRLTITKTGKQFTGQVKWRTDDEIGIQFVK